MGTTSGSVTRCYNSNGELAGTKYFGYMCKQPAQIESCLKGNEVIVAGDNGSFRAISRVV